MAVFWDMTTCSMVKIYESFEGTSYLLFSVGNFKLIRSDYCKVSMNTITRIASSSHRLVDGLLNYF
jgi:hypothetical protein